MPRLRVLAYSPQPGALAASIADLAQQGFEVRGTTSEAEALSALQSGACDLLLFGLAPRMPGDRPWALVLVRVGPHSAVAVSTPAGQPIAAMEGRASELQQALARAGALRDAADGALLSQLAGIAKIVEGEQGAEPTLSGLVDALAKLTRAKLWIMLKRGSELALRSASSPGDPPPQAVEMFRWTAEKGQALLVAPGLAPAEWRQRAAQADHQGFALPLKTASAQGAAVFLSDGGAHVTSHVVQMASLFLPFLALLLEQGQLKKQGEEALQEASQLREHLERLRQEVRALNILLQKQQTSLLTLQEKEDAWRSRPLETLRALVNLLETGDPARGGLSEKTAHWAALLAKRLELTPESLAQAAYLHDVAMPPAREGASAEQRQEVLRHPFAAEQVARALRLPVEAGLAAQHHHENFDGSGYPDGLRGDGIPLGARLLRVVDDLVALTSAPEKPLSAAEALVRLRAGSSREYDPQVLDALEETVRENAGRAAPELISTVTHELRSPLTSLVGFSELLSTQEDLPLQAREQAREIHEEALHMARLVEDMLQVSRYEAGRMEFRWQQTDLAALINRAVAKIKLRSPRHQVEALLPQEPLRARADPDKLLQVLDNLLDNAVKYSPEGRRITVKLERSGGQGRVSVSDEGIGISKEQSSRLFEKFYRADSPLKDTVPGTGLGLYLCKHIITAHGGTIWVDSEEGKGSIFTFALPL